MKTVGDTITLFNKQLSRTYRFQNWSIVVTVGMEFKGGFALSYSKYAIANTINTDFDIHISDNIVSLSHVLLSTFYL